MGKHANKKQPPQQQAPQQTPVEIAQVPGFFGHEMQPGQALQWANEVEEFVLNVNSAALGAQVAEGRSTLFVKVKGTKVALCTLAPQGAEQWNLTQSFTPLDGEVEFLVEGANAIHLTGFIDVQDEEDSGDEHDFDDDDHALDVGVEGEEGEGEEGDSDDMMVFGAAGSSDDETESDEEDEEAPDAENRFEVLEERVHVHKDEAKPAKKADVKSPAKEPKKQEQAKKQEVKQQEAKKASATKEKAALEAAKAKKQADKIAKEKAAAEAAKAKKQADKIAELTASATGKKRPAPSDAVDVPKKQAKTSRPYKGITIEEQAVGKGKGVQKGKKVSILYRGRLENGKQFDAAQNRKKPFTFRHGIGDVIKGMDIGIEGMRAGGKRTIHIPAKLGYGRSGAPPTIPGNANLIFDIELL